MGSLMNYFEDKKPMRVREREIRKSSIKAEKKSRSVQINQQKVANTKGGGVGNFALGAFAGYIVGKKQAGKGSFRIEKWSSRVTRKHGGVRGGNSFVVKDRNQAFAEAHKAMKQNPKGEVKVVDQSNHQVILKLP